MRGCVPYTDHPLPGAIIGSNPSISSLKQSVDDLSNCEVVTCSVSITSSLYSAQAAKTSYLASARPARTSAGLIIRENLDGFLASLLFRP
jgi:hypothetical protein